MFGSQLYIIYYIKIYIEFFKFLLYIIFYILHKLKDIWNFII